MRSRIRQVMADNAFRDLEAAVDEVLASRAFQRAPVLSRLLSYLLRATIKGEPVKAYAIATDGLGKSLAELGESDTYARVAVNRLRKALDAYAAKRPGSDSIQVDVGTYRLTLHRREKLLDATARGSDADRTSRQQASSTP